MLRQLIQTFGEETFGESYTVAPFDSSTVELLGIAVKKYRPWWKRPFGKSSLVITGSLKDYVVSDQQDVLTEFLNEKVKKGTCYRKEETQDVYKKVHANLNVSKVVHGNLDLYQSLGDLQLGEVQQEFISDRNIRGILREASLDPSEIEEVDPNGTATKYIIHAVVYSEKMQVVGKQMSSYSGEVGVKIPVAGPVPTDVNVGLSSEYSSTAAPSRDTRAPLLFAYTKVIRDSSGLHFSLPPGDIIGERFIDMGSKHVHRDEENQKPVVETKENHSICTKEDVLHIDNLHSKLDNVISLLETCSGYERDAKLKTYLSYFEEAMNACQGGRDSSEMEQLIKENATEEEHKFFEAAGFEVTKDMEMMKLKKNQVQNARDYGTILKYLNDAPQETLDNLIRRERLKMEPKEGAV